MQGFPTGVPLGHTGHPTHPHSNGAMTSTAVPAQTPEVFVAAQGAPPGALVHSMGPPPQPQHITVERGCQKKTRLVWTQELHMRFLTAVEKIGLRTAVPRTILQVMDVEGLTRENIASHLQKYRRLLEKKAGISGPVGTKDWPKLEAVQTQHLQSLRKQVSEAQTSQAAAGATAATPPTEAAAASMQPAPSTSAGIPSPTSDATTPNALPTPMDAHNTPAAVVTAPSAAEPPIEHPPSMDMMWQENPQAPLAAASCMPLPAAPVSHAQHLQAPGMCPVPPREPPHVPVPVCPDADGHTLGVPVPQSIVPPFMCVMPQHDGAPTLLPMLPAMYLAACGKNTPDTMGSVAITHGQVPGMHPAAPMMQMPMHVNPYGMPVPGHMPYPMPMQPAPTMAAGAGQPMFPGFAPPMMHMPPMPHDAMGMAPEAPPWGNVPAWRPPRHCKPASQSTLPPLTADHPMPPSAATAAPRPPQPTSMPALPHNMSHEALPRAHSGASGPPGSVPDEGSGGGGTAGVASNLQGIANIKLESDTEAPPPPLEPIDGVDVALDDMGVDTAMDMDTEELGWPGWPEAGSSEELKPELGLEAGLEAAVSSAAADPMTDAFADILRSPDKDDDAVDEALE